MNYIEEIVICPVWKMRYLKFNLRILILMAIFILQGCVNSDELPIHIDRRGRAIAATDEGAYYDDYDDYGDGVEGASNGSGRSGYEKVNDPIEKFNRAMFKFNIFLLENIAAPCISFYKKIIPKFIRRMVSNIGERVQDPMILVNSILQLDFMNILKTLGVFTTNMTLGLAGLFDPAKEWFSLEREKRDMGQTLALYGFKGGFFVMAPIFGPYTFRDGFGFTASFYSNPLSFNGFSVGKEGSWTPWYLVAPKYFAAYVDTVDGAVQLNENFVRKAFDPYVFMRDSYLQNRNYNVGKVKDKWTGKNEKEE